MKNFCKLALLCLPWLVNPTLADLRVFATLPEWGALATELGGVHVKVFTATAGLQDPHHIQAKPSLLAAARNSQLIIATGASLEIGWLPPVLASTGQANLQPGQSGYLEAASLVRLLDKPTLVDRSMGDVHPEGNPHLQLDPDNILKVGEKLSERLQLLDAANAADYKKRWEDFSKRWKSAIEEWKKRAEPLKDVPVVVQHQGFSYLYTWTGLKEVATLEPKPGIPATAPYLSSLLAQLQAKPAKMILRAAYQADRDATWLSEKTSTPVVVLPFTVGGDDKARDLFSLFDDTLDRLLAALKK